MGRKAISLLLSEHRSNHFNHQQDSAFYKCRIGHLRTLPLSTGAPSYPATMADHFLGFDLSTQQLKGQSAPPKLPRHPTSIPYNMGGKFTDIGVGLL